MVNLPPTHTLFFVSGANLGQTVQAVGNDAILGPNTHTMMANARPLHPCQRKCTSSCHKCSRSEWASCSSSGLHASASGRRQQGWPQGPSTVWYSRLPSKVQRHDAGGTSSMATACSLIRVRIEHWMGTSSLAPQHGTVEASISS